MDRLVLGHLVSVSRLLARGAQPHRNRIPRQRVLLEDARCSNLPPCGANTRCSFVLNRLDPLAEGVFPVFSSPPLRRTVVAVLVVISCLVASADRVCAERPSAPKLLPKKTLAYVRVADSRDLVERFKQTSMGRLGQDEKIKPLVMQLYGSAVQAFEQVQDQLGVTLDEVLSIPQGEVCVALVGREDGEPAVFILMDVGDRLPAVRKLLDAAERQAISEGQTKRTEDVDGVTLTILDDKVTFCDRENTVLFSTSSGLVKEVLKIWSGDEGVETLSDNVQFTTIMRTSVGTKDERPQVTWFVDPIELFENVSRQNAGGQMALAVLPMLGLDGIKSAGGSFIFATEEFDSVSHMHLLLDNPRSGIVEMLAVEAGDVAPEDWVPTDAASYMTVNWNLQKSVDSLRKLFDTFRGDGALSGAIKNRLSAPLGVDFEKDVLGQLDDRLTHVSWFEKPARVNSGTNLIGVKLKNASTFRGTLSTILSKAGDRGAEKNYRGVTYHEFTPRRQPADFDQTMMRLPSPCLAIVGDYLLASDSVSCLEAAISAKLDPSKSFADELDYKLIASRVQQHLGSRKPGMIAFQRPEESMRSFYELATSPTTHRRLDELAETNQALRALNDALKANPLPPFSVIAQYLAPGGGMLVNDESGFHYTTFALKRE